MTILRMYFWRSYFINGRLGCCWKEEIHTKIGPKSSLKGVSSENGLQMDVEFCIQENGMDWLRPGSYGRLHTYDQLRGIPEY
jgi:hypothetical protein